MSHILSKDNVNYESDEEERVFHAIVKQLIDYLIDFMPPFLSSDFEMFYEKVCANMKDSLIDMYNNPDKRFIKKYFDVHFKCECIVPKLDCDDVFSNYTRMIHKRGYIGYFFNLYTILMAYEKQKDNFDNFSCVVDDIEPIDQHIYSISLFPFESYFLQLKPLIDYIVSLNDYEQQLIVRKEFQDLVRINNNYVSIYIQPLLHSVATDINLFQDKYDVNYSIITKIINHDWGHSKQLKYTSILLIGDRFDFFNNNLERLGINNSLRKEILSKVSKFSFSLFDSDKSKDLFIECMEKVFDSDSYLELSNKLDFLQEASDLYEKGKKEVIFSLIKGLDSDSHKEIYCGQVVCYPTNTMNLITKPDKIIDRMKYLYGKIDGSISYDFIDEVCDNAQSIEGIYLDLEKAFTENKSFFGKLKNKFIRRK